MTTALPTQTAAPLADLLTNLDAGVFAGKLEAALKQVALGVVINNKQGKIVMELTLKKTDNDSDQVVISHKMKYDLPTKRGKLVEEDTTATPMYVGRGGTLSLFPLTHQTHQGE